MKKINFRNGNGFAKLVEGESSNFSFVKDEENTACDVSCKVQCKSIAVSSTLASPKPYSVEANKPQTTEMPKLAMVKNDVITSYLPPVSEFFTEKSTSQSIISKAFSSTLRTTAQTTRTTKNITSKTTTTKKPQTTTTVAPKTTKALTTKTTKALSTQTTSIPTIQTTTSYSIPTIETTTSYSTPIIETTTSESTPTTSLTSTTIKLTSSPPRPYVAKKDDGRGPPYLPPYIQADEAARIRSTLTPRVITSSSIPTLRQTVATQRITQSLVNTQRAITTHRFNTQSPAAQHITVPAATRRSTPGPAYLPIARKSTVRRSTVTERSYPPATWTSTTRRYTQTFPSWSAPIRRSTEARIATSTGKYSYRAPANSLIYAGEAE